MYKAGETWRSREEARCHVAADMMAAFEVPWQFTGWETHSGSKERTSSIIEGLLRSVYYFFSEQNRVLERALMGGGRTQKTG